MTRALRHERVSAALTLLSDAGVAALLDEHARPDAVGIGGHTATLSVAGSPVFIKQVPVTALDLQHPHSTANLFGLPMYCQYGVGSTGFGAWRELAAHRITTGWVLAGRHAAFPILHHWRVLPAGFAWQPVDIEERVAYWGGAPSVRHRLTQLQDAPARLVLFLEHLPRTVHDLLRADPSAAGRVDARLRDAIAFMNAAGLWHFDGHFNNVLTDGDQVYFADYGLALHEGFDLTAPERAWLREHVDYDLRYTTGHLATWLAEEFRGPSSRAAVLRGEAPFLGPAVAAELVRRYGERALVTDAFFDALVTGAKTTPYPSCPGSL
ncbi:hypothetical protein ACFO1B_04135 [Dactylosporangium siamense]|uniref:Protein kinase domain-containing protein n=1 Tax=Dactylosporangium siamense TaxID=685454 RepID=A0A919U8M2_9ACTN|nr:hypothetical protein [Dactylosporangium siamense]GIG42925.1 hypothetical protein Dsi01nite_009660 [Dactylosporangium siamense]